MEQTDRKRLERVARLYASNRGASQALGITPGSFGRLCRRYGIETPYKRRQRRDNCLKPIRKRGKEDR
jgi:hypothetical protein